VKLPLLFAVTDEGVIYALAYCQSERSWTLHQFTGLGVQEQSSADGRIMPIANRAHMLSLLGAAPTLAGAMAGSNAQMIVLEDAQPHDYSKLIRRMKNQQCPGVLEETRCIAKAVAELPEYEQRMMRSRFGLAPDDPRQHLLTHLAEHEGIARDELVQMEQRVNARVRELLQNQNR